MSETDERLCDRIPGGQVRGSDGAGTFTESIAGHAHPRHQRRG